MTAGRKTYHREDLRAELLAAGRLLVARDGHVALSMRDLAQQVGVSPAAPYRHFPDRRAFLLALALMGFADLLGRARAFLTGEQSSLAKLEGVARLFLLFAEEQPSMLALMYESELTSPALDPKIAEAQFEGYRALRHGVAALRPDLTGSEIDVRVVGLWSALYGFASLRNRDLIRSYLDPDTDLGPIAAAVAQQAVAAAISRG